MGDIPTKIQSALAKQLNGGELVRAVLKSTWKPSATIPILWVAVTNQRCLLFTSLRGSHCYASAPFPSINAAYRERDRLRILFNDSSEDWVLPIDATHVEGIDAFLAFVKKGG